MRGLHNSQCNEVLCWLSACRLWNHKIFGTIVTEIVEWSEENESTENFLVKILKYFQNNNLNALQFIIWVCFKSTRNKYLSKTGFSMMNELGTEEKTQFKVLLLFLLLILKIINRFNKDIVNDNRETILVARWDKFTGLSKNKLIQRTSFYYVLLHLFHYSNFGQW